MNFRDDYEFDPEIYQGAGGLYGRLQAVMRSGRLGPDLGSNTATTPPPLLAKPTAPANSGQNPSASPDPNFRQLVRVSADSPAQSAIGFSDRYEFDPKIYQGTGGLPGWMQATTTPGQTSFDPGLNRSRAYDDNPDTFSGEAGLLGRSRAVAAQGNTEYQLVPESSAPPPAPLDPNFRQLSRISNSPPLPTSSPAASYADGSLPFPETIQLNETDMAQQAREAAAARLARGIRSTARAQAPEPDLADIAKSTGIGLVNGAINTVGLLGEIPTGVGHLPKNFVRNGARHLLGYPDLPADAPDWIRDHLTPNAIRQLIENYTGEFYQPKTRAGRYGETIGEFVPLALEGWSGGLAAGTGAGVRALGRHFLTDAVVPGTVIQGLEEAYPESQWGPDLKTAWPKIRSSLSLAQAAKRYSKP